MKLIHKKDLIQTLGICAKTLKRWRDAGRLPPPDVDVNPHSQWWRPDTLQQAGFEVASPPTLEASADARA